MIDSQSVQMPARMVRPNLDDAIEYVLGGHIGGAIDDESQIRIPERGEAHMRIGELAQRTGVSQRSLRYYEQQQLPVDDFDPPRRF